MQKLPGEYDNLLKRVIVQGLTPELKKNLDIPKRITGVVTDTEEGSPAKGLLIQNDVMIEINGKSIDSKKDMRPLFHGSSQDRISCSLSSETDRQFI